MLNSITVYGTADCIWCKRARELLEKRGYQHRYVDIGAAGERDALIDRLVDNVPDPTKFTVPQIFLGPDHIGGFTDLARLDKTGALAVAINGVN